MGCNVLSQPYSSLLWRHDVEPEILVQIDEVAHELHELCRVTGEFDQPSLDRVLERQLLGRTLVKVARSTVTVTSALASV